MGGGLGSGLARDTPAGDKVSSSQEAGDNKGDDLKQKGFDLNDEPLISHLEEVEVEKEEECREEGGVGNPKVGELNENDGKQGSVENTEDNSVKKKLKDEGLEGKVQFSGRVLRSAFALKNRREEEGESVGDKSGDSGGCEKKSVEAVKEENVPSHCEGKDVKLKPGMKCSDGNDRETVAVQRVPCSNSDCGKVGKKVKRKRGRPPKCQANNGFENKAVELQAGKNNHSEGELKVFKRKPGRPPKNLGNSGFQKQAVKREVGGSDHFDGDVGKQVKRKRGRPPKVQRNTEFEKTAVKMEPGESVQSDGEGNKESEDKCGRPAKVQRGQGFEKKTVEVEASESNRSDVETRKEGIHTVKVETGESDHLKCDLRKEVRLKRGRPPKVQSSDALEKKRVELEREGIDDNNIKRRKSVVQKRGRPPKLQVGNEVLKGKVIDGRKKFSGLKRGRKKLSGNLKVNVPANSSYSEKRLIGKESNARRSVSANKVGFECAEKNDSNASVTWRPEVVNVKSKEMRVKTSGGNEQRRSKAKQAVRDRIIKMLKAAGWTTDYRPRFNREYCDAVYVSPEGKHCWSVTLAYKVLKDCYGSEDCNSKVSPNGFIFTPIPEEELSLLTRIVTKERVDKNKKRGGKNNMVEDGEVKKKINKRKKKWKGNQGSENTKKKKRQKLLKEKILLHEEDNSDGTSQKGTHVSGRKHKLPQTQKGKRYALLVRNSMDGAESENDGYVLYDGKRTVLAWMIDLGIVPQDGKVEYLIQRRTRATREGKSGRITGDGIRCNCCSDVFPVAEFATHAGSRLHQPFLNICLETGTPLLQCLLDAWNKQQQSKCKGFHYVDFNGEDPNDDTCGICGDGGDLICCDSCPSTFHQSCLEINAFPSGNWHCVYCTCKYCGMVETTHQRDKDDGLDPAVLACHLCEEKYHQSCIQTVDAFDDDSSSASFCGKKCKELFERLQKLVGVKHDLPEGFSWTLLHRFDISSDVCLSEAYQKVESNSKLAVASSVMDECFLPLVDHRSGANLIHNIVYNFGSNFTRLNYSGFFTAILERGDEIISAASIRIHGNQLAEMPYIGTRYTCRRQGMCRRLLSAIESALSSLNIEKLVIPAISELRETWTSVFGFQPLEKASKQKMKNMNMLVFPGVDMLQKPLLMHVKEQILDDRSKKSGAECSVLFDLNVSAESPAPQADERNGEPAAIELTSVLPDGTLKDTADLMGEAINLSDSATDSCSCIPASGKRELNFDSQLRIPSEVNVDESIIKQNLNCKHEVSVKHSDDIIPADNEVHVSEVAGQNVVTNGFDGTIPMSEGTKETKHHENSKFMATERVSAFDKMTLQTEEVANDHAIAKEVANQTSPSALVIAQDVANGHYAASSNDTKSSHSCQGDRIGAAGESLAPVIVNSHPCEVCDDTSNKEKLQLGRLMPPEAVSDGSEVAVTILHDPKETETAIQSGFCEHNSVTNMAQMKTKSSEHPVSSSQVDNPHATPCDSESFCNINSGSGVALNCASGGGESRGPEVIVLSNQAS